jgi:hypothetical protein
MEVVLLASHKYLPLAKVTFQASGSLFIPVDGQAGDRDAAAHGPLRLASHVPGDVLGGGIVDDGSKEGSRSNAGKARPKPRCTPDPSLV